MGIKRILFIFLLLIPISIFSLEYPKINSKIVEIYDLNDNKILYEIKSDDVVSIASLTKIATVMVAIEKINNLDEKVLITNDMLSKVDEEAHIAGLKKGSMVTYRDLLYATLIESGADAAIALAISCNESLSNHVDMMNELAKKVGLNHTHFKNVVGLDDKDNYSTAADVRKLLIYALGNSLFKEIYTTKKYTLTNGLTVNTTLKLYDNKGSIDTTFIIGSKTGFTDAAGYCLASLVNINGHDIIIVSLNASRSGNNFYSLIDANTLFNFLRNNYQYRVLVTKNSIIKELPVNLSDIQKYTVYNDQEIKKYLPSDYDITKLQIEYNGLEELDYKNHVGEKIGVISYYYDNELITNEEVILKEKININLLKLIKQYLLFVIISALIIIFLMIKIIRKKIYKKKHHVLKKGM